MYLFVFVFLIISIMGLYTELMSIRVARIAANQKAAAETMMVWHGAAYEYIKKSMSEGEAFVDGCSLTPGFGAACALQLPVYLADPPAGSPRFGRNYLPQGYSGPNWQTVFYTIAGTNYLMTFVPPNTMWLGYNANQILRQMRNSSFPKISYGSVDTANCIGVGNERWLLTGEFVNTTVPVVSNRQVCYPVPAIAVDDSVGIVSNLGSP